MTKSMLEKCLNKEMRAFCALDKNVRDAILNNHNHAQCAQTKFCIFGWGPIGYERDRIESCDGAAWRLSPDTPTEPEYEELEFDADNQIYGRKESHGIWMSASEWVSHKCFIGIIYTLNGVETLRTSVDAAFGTPIRVRFAKGE